MAHDPIADARRALVRARTCERHGTLHARPPQREFYCVIRDLLEIQSDDEEVTAEVQSALRAVRKYVSPLYDPNLVDDAWIQKELGVVPRQIVPVRSFK